jgi:hypothetical protein
MLLISRQELQSSPPLREGEDVPVSFHPGLRKSNWIAQASVRFEGPGAHVDAHVHMQPGAPEPSARRASLSFNSTART